jgi:uncharacterized protein YjiS (DUF1127 family)
MNTHPLPNPWLHLASWQPLRWLQAHWPTPRSWTDRGDGLETLIELDAHTLKDIGAPDRLMSRAQAHREAQQRCRDDLLAGSPSAGWRHW